MSTAELRRNLWLELSPQRIIALPAIVVIVVLMQQATGGATDQLATIGSWLYYGMVLLWGSRRAAAAVTEEVNGGTWIGQRLSALSPSALVLGKLFGATAFVWYGGLIGLGLFLFGMLDARLPLEWVLAELVYRVAFGVFVHAAAVAASLVLLNKRLLVERIGTTLPQVLALLVGLGSFMVMWRSPLIFSYFADDLGAPIAWYGLDIAPTLFFPIVTLVFAGWAVLACLRLMAVQLQRLPLPWAWPAFTLFIIAFVQGFVAAGGRGSYDLGPFPPLLALPLFYLALFADRNEPLRFRHCFAAFGGGRICRGLALVPWWAFGWVILLVAALWPSGLDETGKAFMDEAARRFDVAMLDPVLARLGFAAFALRDAAFVLWINAGRSRHGDLVAFIYLLVLYGPVLVLILALEAWTAAALIGPLPLGPAWLGIGSALVQAAALAVLTGRRWQALFRS